MKERPILFSGPMVRAILDGSKTQTRRVAIPKRSCIDFIGGGTKDGPDWNDPTCWGFEDPNTGFWWALCGNDECHQLPCPHGSPGDRLWVRETWQHSNHPFGPYESDCAVFYRADYLDDPLGPDLERSADGIRREWRPSIHMPRAAARLVLEVTGVRVQRLQAISWDDAIAEGIKDPRRAAVRVDPIEGTVAQFRQLWDGLNAARGHGWDANPWVWVVEFKRLGAGE